MLEALVGGSMGGRGRVVLLAMGGRSPARCPAASAMAFDGGNAEHGQLREAPLVVGAALAAVGIGQQPRGQKGGVGSEGPEMLATAAADLDLDWLRETKRE